jgi:hypothetical protein
MTLAGDNLLPALFMPVNHLIAGVVDTGDKQIIKNIFANVCKNSKQPQWYTQKKT